MKISKSIALLIFVSAVLVMINACNRGPVCGNSELEEGEDSTTCCLDAGCIGEQTCVNNTCEEPECGNCQYIDDEKHICMDYECCNDSECPADEGCSDHECKKITCGYCKYIEEHNCKALVCCDDSDCDDNNKETIDLCKFPATKSAECTHESVNECESDADCDDNNHSTRDSCSVGKPHECMNIPIIECEDGDDYCPEECNYKNDDDCEEKEIECGDDDLDCFNDALEECLLADLTLTVHDDNNESVDKEITTYFRIEEEDDDKCEVFFRTEKIDIEFTDDYIDELQDDPYNYTEEEIEDLEDDAQDDADELEGNDWTCHFEDYDNLVDILNDWEDGDYAISDFESYECEGDYFD